MKGVYYLEHDSVIVLIHWIVLLTYCLLTILTNLLASQIVFLPVHICTSRTLVEGVYLDH